MCVICTHEISLIRVAVTHQTLRSYGGCKDGGGGAQKDTDADWTSEHSRGPVEGRG